MQSIPFSLQRGKLFDDFRRKVSRTDISMTEFLLSDSKLHAQYLMDLFHLFNIRQKFTPPAYFYITNPRRFQANNIPLDSLEEGYNPVAYPLISIQANSLHVPSQYHEQQEPEPNFNLLKPMIVTMAGNYDFAQGNTNYLLLDKESLENNQIHYDHNDYLVSWEESEFIKLLPFITKHLSGSRGYHFPASFFHAQPKSQGGIIVPTEEVINSFDYDLFKQFWPIFDWDRVGKPFHTILRPNISL